MSFELNANRKSLLIVGIKISEIGLVTLEVPAKVMKT